MRWRDKDGRIIDFEGSSSAHTDDNGRFISTRCILRNVTERKHAETAIKLNEARLEALLKLGQLSQVSLQEIADFALAEAIKLTSSTMGYLAFTNEDETALIMFAWSALARAQCNIADKPTVYAVDQTGLWGEPLRQRRPIITNDYAADNPLKRGVPEGHVPMTRHMNIPVFDGERIVAVAGVANKETDYDESDVRQLVLMMDGMWRVIQRNQSDENRRKFEKQVEQQKQQFYRETILSVTDAKLDICEESDLRQYLSNTQEKFDVLQASDVALARHAAERFLHMHGLEGERLEVFMIGVGEAITNAVKHATQGQVCLGATDDSLWVAVDDKGTGISSLILPRATLMKGFSTKPSMGLGYSIMLDVCDKILLRTNEQGTTVVLVKERVEPQLHANANRLPDTWQSIPG